MIKINKMFKQILRIKLGKIKIIIIPSNNKKETKNYKSQVWIEWFIITQTKRSNGILHKFWKQDIITW